MDRRLLVLDMIRPLAVSDQVVRQPLHVRLHVRLHVETLPWERRLPRPVTLVILDWRDAFSESKTYDPSLSIPNTFSHTGFRSVSDGTLCPLSMIRFDSQRATPPEPRCSGKPIDQGPESQRYLWIPPETKEKTRIA